MRGWRRDSFGNGYRRGFHNRGYGSFGGDGYRESRTLFGRRHQYGYGRRRTLLGCRQQHGYENSQPFYRRQDGYDNYYGSEMLEPSLTSKILAGLTGLAGKAKSSIHRKPQAASSNVQYDGSVRDGDYVEARSLRTAMTSIWILIPVPVLVKFLITIMVLM